MKGFKRNEKGITLIALVITIIVLLILTGIAIASLTGDNSILQMAIRAKEETQRASEYEQDKLELMEILLKEQSGEIEVPTDAVARIGTTYYTTLQSAIDAVPTDNTRTMVVLLKDVSEYITISGTKNVALYLNGNTLSPDTNVSNEDGNETIVVRSGATLMVSDGKVLGIGENGAIGNYGTLSIVEGAEIIAENPEYGTIYNEGNLSVTGGVINGGESGAINNDAYEEDGSYVKGETTISGGEVISNKTPIYNWGNLNVIGGKVYTESNSRPAIYNYFYEEDSGKLTIGEITISGGEVISGYMAVWNKGKLNVTGGTLRGVGYATIFNEYNLLENKTILEGEVTISGGELSSDKSGIVNLGIVNVIKGNIYGGKNGIENSAGAVIGTSPQEYIQGKTTISGGQISSGEYGVYNEGILNATGGTISGENYAIYNGTEEFSGTKTITGEATISTDSVTINGNTNLDI